jgi:hypothetical protein
MEQSSASHRVRGWDLFAAVIIAVICHSSLPRNPLKAWRVLVIILSVSLSYSLQYVIKDWSECWLMLQSCLSMLSGKPNHRKVSAQLLIWRTSLFVSSTREAQMYLSEVVKIHAFKLYFKCPGRVSDSREICWIFCALKNPTEKWVVALTYTGPRNLGFCLGFSYSAGHL